MISPIDLTKVRLGYQIRLLALGILIPGFLVLVEAWLIFGVGRLEGRSVLKIATSELAGVNTLVLVLSAAITLLLAYVVGFLLRQATNFVLRGAPRNAKQVLSRAREDYPGKELLAIVSSIGAATGTPKPDDQGRHGRLSLRDRKQRKELHKSQQEGTLALFLLTKFWLRIYQTELAVDYLETEIVTLTGLIGPLALGSITAWSLLHDARGVIAAIVVAVMTVLVVAQIYSLRKSEPWEAVRAYLLAQFYRGLQPLPQPGDVKDSGHDPADGDSGERRDG